MKTRPERLLEGVLFYASSEAFIRVLGLAVSVLVSRHLGLIALGELTVAQNLVQYALVAGDAGLTALGMAEIAKGLELRRVVLPITIAQITLSAAASLVVVGVAAVLSPKVDVVTVVALSPLALAYALNLSYVLQAERRLSTYAAARIGGQIVGTALTASIIYAGGSIAVVAASMCCGPFVAAAIVAKDVWPRLASHTSGDLLRAVRNVSTSIRQGAHYLKNGFLLHVYWSTTVVLLAVLASPTVVAEYAVGFRLALVAASVGQIFAWTWFPRLIRIDHERGHDRAVPEIVTGVIIIAGSVATFAAIATRPILAGLYGSAPGSSALVLQILCIHLPFTYFTALMQVVLLALGHGRRQIRIVGVGTILLIAATLIAIPTVGAVGAALSLLVAEIVMTFLLLRTYGEIIGRSPLIVVTTAVGYLSPLVIAVVATDRAVGLTMALVCGGAILVVEEALWGRIRRFFVALRMA